MNRSNAHIVEGDVEEAIRDLNQVIIIRPHFGSAYLNRGLARFEMDDFASALRDYDQAIRLEPQNALAFNNRGIVKHKLGDYEGAIMDYDMALRLNPEMASGYFNRAMAREILGRTGFQDDYQIAAQLNPQFDLESRRLDAEQLAQNQQSQQGQSQTGASSGQSGTQQQSANQSSAQQDSTQQSSAVQATQEDSDDEKNENRRNRRQRINLVVEDSRNLPSDNEDEVDDGRVQNRNIEIDLQPIFIVSAFEKNAVDYERSQYYNLAIDELNQVNNYNPILTITNKPVNEYNEVFENFILYFNARLNINKSSHNYLNRGIFYSLTGDYNTALEDLNRSLEMDKSQAIAFFSLGNTRYKILEQIELLSNTRDEVSVPIGSFNQQMNPDEPIALPEYQKIMNDYQALLYLKPKFFFGYYNRAYIKLRLKEYKSAIEDLNKAIELEPEFAEAYFNRGLTKIFLDDIEGGALDLSRAGELGIEGAYNIIKRYCN
jgi:tetratricopeptide (TPR) repeat protein